MKFIALISGGKDSTFAIHECQRQGHELVALANLYPLVDDEEEGPSSTNTTGDLDSWCFQTVGHGLVASYSRCVPRGVPLYRRATRGAARRKGLSYPPGRATPGDEVEDLAALLAFVAERHRDGGGAGAAAAAPSPLGVCSGAVASDYQRLRVEAVACGRLGLVSLAPLWRRPQYPLLRAMDRAGLRAVVAKVAAAGLDPRRDLGADVACGAMRRRLAKLRDTYGLNVAGEGGEYETLTLDAPIGVFPRGRVEFVEGSAGAAASDGERSEGGWRLVVTSEDAVAPGGVLVPVSFLVVPRDGGGDDEQPSGRVVEVPRAYEAPAPAEEGQAEEREDASKGGESGGLRTQVLVRLTKDHAVVGCRVHQCRVGGGGPVAPPTADATARAVRLALRAVERAANPSSSSSSTPVWPRALFVHLLLRDMAHFAAANAAYCSVVPLLRPPARACVEAALPDGCLLHVDVLMLRGAVGASGEGVGVDGAEEKQEDAAAANDNNDDDDDGVGGERAQAAMGRRVLHVQSISPWAPACIGPYSQAAADGRGGLLHLAGQIPLDPASMAMLGPAAAADEEGGGGGGGGGDNGGCSCSPATLLKHTDRVLRSCQAVAVASGGRMDGGACAGAAVYLSPEARAAAATAAVAVAGFLRQGRTAQEQQQQQSDEGDEEDEDHDDFVDEYLRPLQLPRERVRVTQASWSVGSGEGGGGGGAAAADGDAAAAAPCVYAVVPALPRGSLVEAQPTLLDLRAFAPGGGAGEPPSSSSSSSEDEEEEEEDEPAATASAAAAPPLAADAAALAAATGATAHLRAYSWLSRGSPPAGRRGRQPPQRRLAARLLVALPAGGTEGGQHCDAAAAVVASALAEASRNGVIADATAPLNVVSLRAWCTPEAYAELAGGVEEEQEDEGDGGRSPLDAALARLGAPCGAQLLPADEVRWCCPGGDDDDHAATLSPPCAAVFELVVLQ